MVNRETVNFQKGLGLANYYLIFVHLNSKLQTNLRLFFVIVQVLSLISNPIVWNALQAAIA